MNGTASAMKPSSRRKLRNPRSERVAVWGRPRFPRPVIAFPSPWDLVNTFHLGSPDSSGLPRQEAERDYPDLFPFLILMGVDSGGDRESGPIRNGYWTVKPRSIANRRRNASLRLVSSLTRWTMVYPESSSPFRRTRPSLVNTNE